MVAKSIHRTTWKRLKPKGLLVFTGESSETRVSEVVRNGFRPSTVYTAKAVKERNVPDLRHEREAAKVGRPNKLSTPSIERKRSKRSSASCHQAVKLACLKLRTQSRSHECGAVHGEPTSWFRFEHPAPNKRSPMALLHGIPCTREGNALNSPCTSTEAIAKGTSLLNFRLSKNMKNTTTFTHYRSIYSPAFFIRNPQQQPVSFLRLRERDRQSFRAAG